MTSTRIRALVVVVVVLLLAGGVLFAIKGRAPAPRTESKPAPMVAQVPHEPAEAKVERASFTRASELRFGSAESYDKMARQNAGIKPNVPDYKVSTGMANVANRKIYKSLLEPKLVEMIARNGFAVAPTDYIQMFHVYENNEYQRPLKFPSFITTDSMLHTYQDRKSVV